MMDHRTFVARNRQQWLADSPWELTFAETVLGQIAQLDFDRVSVQTEFQESIGRDRRIDFAIAEGEYVRIAIECDGYNKVPGQQGGMTHDAFVYWLRRETAMVQQGWRVLRFPNREIRDAPDRCARAVQMTLNRERELARLLETRHGLGTELARTQADLRAARETAKTALTELQAKERALQQAKRDDAPGQKRELEAMVEQQAKHLADLRAQLAEREQAATRALLPPEQAAAFEALQQENARREEELRAAVEKLGSTTKENGGMKTIAVAMAVAMACAALVTFLVVSLQSKPPVATAEAAPVAASAAPPTVLAPAAAANEVSVAPAPQPSPAPTPVAAAAPLPPQPVAVAPTEPVPPPVAPAKEPKHAASPKPEKAAASGNIEWSRAGESVGKWVTVVGPVVDASYRENSPRKPTFLNIGKRFPQKDRVSVVVFSQFRGKFHEPPELAFRGKTIEVRGIVTSEDGVATMVVTGPEQIRVVR